MPAAPLPPPPPATTYAICLCVKSFDTVLMSLQTVVEKWCQTFHHQVGLPACSVELKRVSVHFKWPCWSPRCLVKPVKMACPPSPGSCRCRKSIPRLGCNLPNRVEPKCPGPVETHLRFPQSLCGLLASGHLPHDILTFPRGPCAP